MLYRDYAKDKYQNAFQLSNAEGVPCVLKGSKGKKIRNYELYGNSVQDGTPSPESPVEIQSVGDLTTKNLWSFGDLGFTQYKRVVFSQPLPAGTYTVKAYVESTDTDGQYSLFRIIDTDGNDIENISFYFSTEKTRSFTASTMISHIDLYASNGYVNGAGDYCTYTNVQIEAGSTATEYEPYHKYDIPITVTGKNLLKYPYASESSTRNGLTYTINSDASITISGTATDNSYIVLMKNCDFGETSITEGSTNGIYSTSKKLRYNAVNKTVSINFKLGDTVDEIFYPQIEYGTVSTAYEPYKGSETTHIYIDEPLRKIGDYADYIDFKNQNVVRQTGKFVFNGTEKWSSYPLYNGFLYPINDMKFQYSGYGYCNYYVRITSLSKKGLRFGANNNYIYFTQVYSSDSTLTLDEWKTQLSNLYAEGNPLIVEYILETPIEENISLPSLKTFKDTNLISVDSTISSSNIKAKYIKK